jgi:hypothetical protein
MPLRDHFHPPLSEERHWESFHATWAGSIADDLNRRLPEGYFAEEHTGGGGAVEIDVATFNGAARQTPTASAAAVAEQVWSPPAPTLTIPAVFSDTFEVRVFATRTGPTLVAAVELVSPRNKDRAEARRAFAVKCASYLHEGISLILVDIVTGRRANLYNEVLRLLESGGGELPAEVMLYAAAYRPVRREGREEIDVWQGRLALGEALPVLPLTINAEVSVPVDLEAAYVDTCQRRRLT